MSATAESLAIATQHFQSGRLQEADAVCRKILDGEPGQLDSLHLLGLIALRGGRHAIAEEHFRRLLEISPASAGAHNSLGEAHRAQGRLDEAIACYSRAMELNPALAEPHCNLAIILRSRGEMERAIQHCHDALRINALLAPQAHNILGGIYFDQREYGKAVDSFRKALEIQPASVEVRMNLTFALRWKGQVLEALHLYFAWLKSDPGNAPLRRGLAEALQGLALGTAGEAERATLVSLCLDDNISTLYLSHAVLGLLRASPEVDALLQATAKGDALDTAEDAFQAFARNPLVIAALPRMGIHDPDLERLLTALRRRALLSGGDQPRDFACALARQCFLGEYALFADKDETRQLKQLQAELESALRHSPIDARALEPRLAVMAQYQALSGLKGWEQLLGAPLTDWSAPFREVVREQLMDRRRERELAGNIASLTKIEDKTSLAVRDMYEENPYPLWNTAHQGDMRSVEDLSRMLRPREAVPAFAHPVPVLVAGCGSGHHPAQISRSLKDCEILAVDLSRASLAYAARRCEQMGIANIRFALADILGLGRLEQRFAVIECGGVLHHMRDPLQGWKILVGLLQPGGLMKIGLYSERARGAMQAPREFARRKKYPPTPDGIRRFRRAVLELPAADPVRAITRFGDFFTLNGCRDLAMHVQEHRFTLPRIAECLEQLGLRFLAMDCGSSTQALFDARFSQPGARTDLALWDRFEEAYPDAFLNMYQFWCCAK